MQKNTTLTLVEGALMIALATILSFIKLFEMPMGGSITLEMIPLIILALRHGPKVGCFTGFVHGLLQMIIGFGNVLYCQTLPAQIGCILLDYLLAFTALGLAGLFAGLLAKHKVFACVSGAFLAGVLRFICSFLSGVLIWGSYAPEDMPVALYSFLYNGAYMLPDVIIVCVVVAILAKSAPILFKTMD